MTMTCTWQWHAWYPPSGHHASQQRVKEVEYNHDHLDSNRNVVAAHKSPHVHLNSVQNRPDQAQSLGTVDDVHHLEEGGKNN